MNVKYCVLLYFHWNILAYIQQRMKDEATSGEFKKKN